MTISITGSAMQYKTGGTNWSCPLAGIGASTDGLTLILAHTTVSGNISGVSLSNPNGLFWFLIDQFIAVTDGGKHYCISVWNAPCGTPVLGPAPPFGGGTAYFDFKGDTVDAAVCALIGTVGYPIPGSIWEDRGTLNGNIAFTGSSISGAVDLNWSSVTTNTLTLAIAVADEGGQDAAPNGFGFVNGGHISGTAAVYLTVGSKNNTSFQNTSLVWTANIPQLVMVFSLTDATTSAGAGSSTTNVLTLTRPKTRILKPTIGK